MKNFVFSSEKLIIVPLLIFLGCFLTGCVASNSQKTNMGLVHGFSQGNSANNGGIGGETALVRSVKPKVTSIFGGRAEEIRPGASVPLTAILRSNATGRAQLELPDRSTVSLGPDSEIDLADFAKAPEKESSVMGFTKNLGRLLTGGSKNGSVTAAGNSGQTSIGIRGIAAE